MHRPHGQAGWLPPADGCVAPSLHCPLTLEVTFGGLPGPCETISVVRVQVLPPLLTETTVVLVWPAGRLPNEAIYGAAPGPAGRLAIS